MEAAERNVAENALPAGLRDSDVSEAVARSGYPLQARVAKLLSPPFAVAEEWSFIDREAGEPRALDVVGTLSLQDGSAYSPQLALLIECKRSELPFVFFEPSVAALPRAFPKIHGLGRSTFDLYEEGRSSFRAVPASRFLALDDLDFVAKGPVTCRAFSRCERSGKRLSLSGEVPFRSVILPLTSASHHWRELVSVDPRQEHFFPRVTLLVCVVDAAMLLVHGDPDAPQSRLEPWVRVERQEAFRDGRSLAYRYDVVDFVHVGFLRTFLNEHAIPFGRQVNGRIQEASQFLRAGAARVVKYDTWKWGDLSANEGPSR